MQLSLFHNNATTWARESRPLLVVHLLLQGVDGSRSRASRVLICPKKADLRGTGAAIWLKPGCALFGSPCSPCNRSHESGAGERGNLLFLLLFCFLPVTMSSSAKDKDPSLPPPVQAASSSSALLLTLQGCSRASQPTHL